MLALLGYPFALEPWVTTRLQSYGWSGAYVAFALLTGHPHGSASPRDRPDQRLRSPAEGTPEASPTLGRQLLWTALAATGSYLLRG